VGGLLGCDELALRDYDDWHLPDIGEMRTLIRGCTETEPGGGCPVTPECLASTCYDIANCQPCNRDEGPVGGCYWPEEMQGPCDGYWSASVREDLPSFHWIVMYHWGGIISRGNDEDYSVRCVRVGS